MLFLQRGQVFLEFREFRVRCFEICLVLGNDVAVLFEKLLLQFVAPRRHLDDEVKFLAIGFADKSGNLGTRIVSFFIHDKSLFGNLAVQQCLFFGHFSFESRTRRRGFRRRISAHPVRFADRFGSKSFHIFLSNRGDVFCINSSSARFVTSLFFRRRDQ